MYEWEYLFKPHILERGRQYARQGAVANIVIKEDQIEDKGQETGGIYGAGEAVLNFLKTASKEVFLKESLSQISAHLKKYKVQELRTLLSLMAYILTLMLKHK